MNKEIQYQYDEADFRERMKLLTQLQFKLEKDKIGNYVVFLVMSIVLGVAFLYFNSDGAGIVFGPILLIVGFIYAGAIIQFFVRKKRYEQNFDQNFDTTIQRLNGSSGTIRYSFTDDYMFYGDDDYEIKLKWELLHSYFHTGTYLYLMADNGNSGAFTLSSTDIPQSDFDEICAFVRKKLHPHALSKLDKNSPKLNNDLIDS